MFLILLILFTCVPALELYLLFQVGGQIGPLNTIAIIIVTGILGASLAKSQGIELLFKIQEKLNKGELPAGQLLQGFLVMGGGLLLLTPGFVTDILGFLMVLPGSRAILAKVITKLFTKQIQRGNIHIFSSFGSGMGNNAGFTGSFGAGFGHQEPKNEDTPKGKVASDVFEAEFSKKDEN